jgi:hypothetical protein
MTLAAANKVIAQYHRHHGPVTGWKFGVGVVKGDELVGVGIAGRPVSRETQAKEPQTLEITRICTLGEPHAASMLYGALSRAAFALGYTRVISAILKRESGTSLRAAGFTFSHDMKGGSWNRKRRPRVDRHDLGEKQCFHRIARA